MFAENTTSNTTALINNSSYGLSRNFEKPTLMSSKKLQTKHSKKFFIVLEKPIGT